MSAPRDELRELLDELEATLAELQAELDVRDRGRSDDRDRATERGRANDRRRADGRRRTNPPQPTGVDDLFRVTGEYTIPALVSLLDATIRSLELFRELLRFTDPGRTGSEPSGPVQSGIDGAGRVATRRAADRLSRTVSELQTALAEADRPQDPDSRRLRDDVRALSAEIERLLAETDPRTGGPRRPGDSTRGDGAVRINVVERSGPVDPNDADGRDADGHGADAGRDDPEVDIEAELESIKDEVRGDGRDSNDRQDDDRGGGDRQDDAEGRSDGEDDAEG